MPLIPIVRFSSFAEKLEERILGDPIHPALKLTFYLPLSQLTSNVFMMIAGQFGCFFGGDPFIIWHNSCSPDSDVLIVANMLSKENLSAVSIASA
jgi:hypothetical protein